MEFLFFMLFGLLILVPVVLGYWIPIYKSHQKVTGGVINYDSSMRKFVYKVSLTEEEIIHLLQYTNDVDELSCIFDFENSVINFLEYGSNREYYFHVQQYDGFSILRLEQVALIGMSSQVPYKLNSFIVSKLHAEIIPFSQYSF